MQAQKVSKLSSLDLLKLAHERLQAEQKAIRGRREAKGMSQLALAELASLSRISLNRIERGHATPDLTTMIRILEAFATLEQQKAAA